jgi:hypothetical protein
MKRKILPILLVLTLGVLIFSCRMNTSNQPDIPDVNAIRTEAVATYAFSLTEALAPTQTVTFAPTSLPTFTPPSTTATLETPINSCYDLFWIEDVTIPDGTQMRANETFTKTWLVQNNGSCAWPPGFMFMHVGGDLMRGETLVLKEPIPVGAKRELSVQLVAPAGVVGLAQSSWSMADENRNAFGDTLSVNIIIGGALTPTP